jgi:hypothetical protein
MERQNLNENQKVSDNKKSGISDSSDNEISQSSEIRTNPDGTPWPKDETLDEFLEKDKANSKMKPGHLDKH